MIKNILLAGAALATLAVPAAADAQYYGRSSGTYSHGRHYYWDGNHYRDRDNNAVLDAVIGGLLGYAVGSAAAGSYGYAYPNYGYANPGYSYSYPAYGYGSNYSSYPGYGYNYQNAYPGYGYNNNYCYYNRC